jgi:hypothetical protein
VRRSLGGFEDQLPKEVSKIRSNLSVKEAEKAIKYLSPSERKELLDRLQALGREHGS